MKIAIIMDDYFDPRGWNGELRNEHIFLRKYSDCEIYAIHLGKKNDFENNVLSIYDKSFVKQIYNMYKILKKEKIDIVHIRGLMSKNHLVYYLGLLLYGRTRYIISLVSQVNLYNLNNKLFFEDPDVNSLLKNKKNYKINDIKRYISPLVKKLYLKTIGKIILLKSTALIFFSSFEKDEYFRNVGISKKYYIVEGAILNFDDLKNLSEKASNTIKTFEKLGYKDKINIVYWGRLDFNLKGIDRLLTAFKNTNNKKLVLHLMGPNYNNGENKIKEFISKHKLKNVIIHNKNIWQGTKQPLRDADLSILASRWDGFPRALRESIALKVPIIVSEETNFADVVNKFDCGFIFRTNEHLIKILNNLSKEQILQKKSKISEAIDYLQEKSIAKKLIEIYEEYINE